MTDLRRLAEETLTLGAIKDSVETAYNDHRHELQRAYVEAGVERQNITDRNGDEFGRIVLPKPSIKVTVTDEDEAVAWVERQHPEHIRKRTIVDIQPSYRKLLIDAAKKAGIGIDPDTNEVLPFIRVEYTDPAITVTPTRDAKRAVAELMQKVNLLELTGGDETQGG